ncbi:hypothetical protein F2Q69_00031693 [Brassica cretica]|uniref:Uncharacterized protein n=1 Tax=Brassica cretica TaxID=69181 RepID=A0A8S9S0H9_BRACR|nr:hypothetical protein F2Q69_00031693 [Brassica cretica]
MVSEYCTGVGPNLLFYFILASLKLGVYVGFSVGVCYGFHIHSFAIHGLRSCYLVLEVYLRCARRKWLFGGMSEDISRGPACDGFFSTGVGPNLFFYFILASLILGVYVVFLVGVCYGFRIHSLAIHGLRLFVGLGPACDGFFSTGVGPNLLFYFILASLILVLLILCFSLATVWFPLAYVAFSVGVCYGFRIHSFAIHGLRMFVGLGGLRSLLFGSDLVEIMSYVASYLVFEVYPRCARRKWLFGGMAEDIPVKQFHGFSRSQICLLMLPLCRISFLEIVCCPPA